MNATSQRYLILLHDVLMVPVAWYVALWFRFNLEDIPQVYLDSSARILPVLLVVQLSCFLLFRLYRGYWRFVSVSDLVKIIKTVLLGMSVTLAIVFLIWRLEAVPRSIFPLYAIMLTGLLSGPRLLTRWSGDRIMRFNEGIPVVIVGAGRAGEMLLRDLMRDTRKGYNPVALVDDDPAKQGKEIHGVRVSGNVDKLERILAKTGAELVILAIPSANTNQMKRIVEKCERAGVLMRTLPRIHDIVSGDVSISTLKEVAIEDLLGRDSVELDWTSISKGLSGRKVLITGGGGSIGSELCRQIARMGPTKLIIADNGEYNLYKVDLELKSVFSGLDIKSVLIDVTDKERIDRLFEDEMPDIVFHAAAYKHVPLLEKQISVAVKNNVIGTKNVADAASKYNTGIFVLVSTDKAVNPTNIMGTTKRIAEMYCQSLNQNSSTRYITVRFGNVLGSAGSVIPLFKKQIASGGPVTVTHRDITRYFMTIPEASQLILQASVLGSGGEIFVLDMGEPIKIAYLAEQMILLSGKKPGEDIDVVYTGLRPGEKLYEELFYSSESHDRTSHNKIFQAAESIMDTKAVEDDITIMTELLVRQDESGLVKILRKMVPENSIVNNGEAVLNHEKIVNFPGKEKHDK